MSPITSILPDVTEPNPGRKNFEKEVQALGTVGTLIEDTMLQAHSITRQFLVAEDVATPQERKLFGSILGDLRKADFSYSDAELDRMSKEERKMILKNALWLFESQMPYANFRESQNRQNNFITNLKRDLVHIWDGRVVDSFAEFDFPMSEGGGRAQSFVESNNQGILESPNRLSSREHKRREEYKLMAFRISRFARYMDADEFGDTFQQVFIRYSPLNHADIQQHNHAVSDLVTEWNMGTEDTHAIRKSHSFDEIFVENSAERRLRLLALRADFWERVRLINENAFHPFYANLRLDLEEVSNLVRCIDSIARASLGKTDDTAEK